MNHIRTDLAIEMHELLTEAAEELSGISTKKKEYQGIPVSQVSIETTDAAQKMGKPQGNYITLELANLNITDSTDYENACHALAEALRTLDPLQNKNNVLVVGLGNRSITPDALGPKVVEKLMVTRHLLSYIPEHIDERIHSVCAISPGVLGTTGMETLEVIQGVTESVKPDAVIVIDALAARSTERISNTIQLCDTGIAPGAGVGNKRKALNQDSLGVPVVAVGVPTVIDAVTITTDLLEAVSEEATTVEHNRDEKRTALMQALPEPLQQFIVTPKDVDMLIDRISKVVANGINLALHEDITFDDIQAYTG